MKARESASAGYGNSPLLREQLPPWRSNITQFVLMMGLVGLGLNACYKQIIESSFYQREGEQRYQRTVTLPAQRGRVLDRTGRLLAASEEVYSVYGVATEQRSKVLDIYSNSEEKLRQLQQLLGMKEDALFKLLRDGRANGKQKQQTYFALQDGVSMDTWQRIAALKLYGIGRSVDYRRKYPEGEYASQVVGLLNAEGNGQEGIERYFDDDLAGENGLVLQQHDRYGHVVAEPLVTKTAENGADIDLTLDSALQFFAYEQLRTAVTQHQAKSGSLVLLDANSGDVLAIANYPSFDPNDRRTLSPTRLANRAVGDAFEIGSTMKPFSIGTALDLGRITPQSMIDIGDGKLQLGRFTIGDAEHLKSRLSVSEVVQYSSNVGTARIAMQVPTANLWETYNNLGFGQRPDLDLPRASVASGSLRPLRTIHDIEKITMSYGYGLAVSLVQLAQAYTAIANDGEMVRASLVRDDSPPVRKRIFNQATARALRSMLSAAAGREGTGARAQTENYTVAGKTGTVRKLVGGQYQKGHYRSLFVGMAPAGKPRIVCAVMIDDSQDGTYYGGLVAAPVFSAVAQRALHDMGVQPDTLYKPPEVIHVVPEEEL